MNRRGLALVATLWVIVGLAAVSAAALTLAREYALGARNRVWMMRTRWALEACGAILNGRYARLASQADAPLSLSSTQTLVGQVDLGDGLWCRVEWEASGQRLNLNDLDATTLTKVVGDPALADAALDWRDPDDLPREQGAEGAWYAARGLRGPRNGPFESIAELALVRGFDAAEVQRLQRVLTVRSFEALDLNVAPLDVIATLPGFGEEALGALAEHRATGTYLLDWHQLATSLSPAASRMLEAAEPLVDPLLRHSGGTYGVEVQAGIHGIPLTSEAWLAVHLENRRLATVLVEAP